MPADDIDAPERQIDLQFRRHEDIAHVDDPVHKDLSAVARSGDSLFFSCDETAGVDRLIPEGDGWGDHVHYNLEDFIALPAGADGEMDIEGLEVDGDWLWVCGSHSLTRGKPEADADPDAALAAFARVKRSPNRYFIGRFPLVDGDGGRVPVARDGNRRAAALKLKKKTSRLIKWLKGDALLDRFLDIPCKENGLDLEGIAASGMTVWLGCRGPVLRGYAVILELRLKLTRAGNLKARRIDGRRRYRKHLIYTGGMGIRDLVRDGDDLLVLTGTPLAGDGPARVLRWRDAVHAERSQMIPGDQVTSVLELPYRGPVDHPEGICPLQEGWLVVYDSPTEERLGPKDGQIRADLFRMDDE